MSVPAHRIDEITLPASMAEDHGGEFAEMIAVRDEIETDIMGTDALTMSAAELLPLYADQEYNPRRIVVVRVDGRIVGRGYFGWSPEAGSKSASVYGEILAAFRTRGLGTALFDHLEGLATDAGYGIFQTYATHTSTEGGERLPSPTGFGTLPAADPGVRFMVRRGYRLEQVSRISAVKLPVDHGVLVALRQTAQDAAGSDYRIVSWLGRTPEEWIDDLATLHNRMSVDMPQGDLDVTEENWDEDRVRSNDERMEAGGRQLLTVAAEHVPSRRLAGFSVLTLPADRTRPVAQEDTLVLSEHRGHRLGMLMKIANLQELARVSPESTMVYTGNAEENRPMLNVNEAVGFRAIGYEGAWKKVIGTAAPERLPSGRARLYLRPGSSPTAGYHAIEGNGVVSLYAGITGSPSSPAIVFLHGVGTSGWMWWRQVPELTGFCCLNVDLPGHGRSRDIPWISLADTAERVSELIRTRTGTGTAHVVGLSLGGHVALTLLDLHPGVVDHAVISGVTAKPWPHRWFVAPQARLTTILLRSRRLVAAQARSLGLPPEMQTVFAENVRAMRGQTYRRIFAEVAASSLPASLAGLRTPTLVVAGSRESDGIRQAVEIIPAAMPGATGRIVPGVSHGWNVEAPELFNQTVRAWIEGTPLPGVLQVPAESRDAL